MHHHGGVEQGSKPIVVYLLMSIIRYMQGLRDSNPLRKNLVPRWRWGFLGLGAPRGFGFRASDFGFLSLSSWTSLMWAPHKHSVAYGNVSRTAPWDIYAPALACSVFSGLEVFGQKGSSVSGF